MPRPRGSRFSVWLPPKPLHTPNVQRYRGRRIGLLGGSFNPAHDGHLAITKEALKRLTLHQVWWLVAPQNPLKDPGQTAPYEDRLESARKIADHPRIVVSDLEHRWHCRYTIETACLLNERYACHDFVWIMGADNFASLHSWQDWTGIVERMPIAVINRPGHLLSAAGSKAAQRYARARLPSFSAAALPCMAAPAWSLIEIPLNSQSSTALRSKNSY